VSSAAGQELNIRDDDGPLTAAIIRLAGQYGPYGYRRVTALLHTEGWPLNHKWVERIWRREGLKVPANQPKRRKGGAKPCFVSSFRSNRRADRA
jgi:transposase InsO family protein